MSAPVVAAQRHHAQRIFQAGLAAADPRQCVRRVLSLSPTHLQLLDEQLPLADVGRIIVVGAGKASASMAAAAESILGERLSAGHVNTKYGHALPLQRLEVTECAHPVPDAAGVAGTRRMLAALAALDARDVVICLLSGGGSALWPAPAAGLSLEDKQVTTQLLLASGASIDEVNTVRKHLSAVKGGQLARQAQPARVYALALSDVIGDPLETIASGPTYPDPSTWVDCQRIVARYGLDARLPIAVRERLEAGGRGELPDTPKPGDPCFARTRTCVVGNSSMAIAAAAAAARQLGYKPLVLSSRMEGEARHVATALVAIAREVQVADRPVARPACLICGGETTVTVQGSGKGGRNQELALAAAVRLDGVGGITLLSGGTDGTDGPTDAAGAVVDGDTLARARRAGLDAGEHLARNDAYHFFQPLGDLLMTGPTQTNVMDLQVIMVG